MRYGLPYQGSKNKIAEWVISNLPKAEHFYDLFAGGCAVTHAAMLSGKYQYFHANDICIKYPQMFLDAINGKYKDEKRVITREEFHKYKDTDPYIALCWSYGNNKKDYLWNPQTEKMKIAACKMLAADNLQERRILYLQFIRTLKQELERGYNPGRLEDLQSLERLQSLQSLQILESLERLQSLQITGVSYDEIEILPNSVVYCDPPYRGTRNYGFEFDSDRFFQWASDIPFPVYISEYSAPDDFISIASVKKQAQFSQKKNNQVTENIFIHKRFLTL